MNKSEKIHQFIQDLVAEAEAVMATLKTIGSGRNLSVIVDLESFSKLRAKCSLLSVMLPANANPWKQQLENDETNLATHAIQTLGILKAIKEAIEAGLLVRYEDLVFAEAFSDLLDQARHLLDQGYLLPAGVLGRAVLEERLNRLCVAKNCSQIKSRPTINDYNSELYKNSVYDKSQYKHVDSMASIGNDAAHGKQIAKEDVEHLLQDVEEFLSRFTT